ncbi:MAG TPA: SpoIID/LytB domain-containing protein [Candidatus Saccharimonadales bacterium]|nr:SpoIID/LytB domain-containing protein [Candidatus Saccharimonadales bacterium]
MKKVLLPVFFLLFLCLFGFYKLHYAKSDELDDVTQKINALNSQLNDSVKATKPLESQLVSMQQQIKDIKARVTGIEVDIAAKKKIIDQNYQDLAKKQLLFNQAVHDFYIQSSYDSPLLAFFSARNAQEITQALAYQKATTDQNETVITNIALSITDLEKKKLALEDEQNKLVTIKASLDIQSAKLDKVVADAKAFQSTLSGQIAQLSAKQQQLVAAKQASLNLPQSAYTTQGGCSSDLDKDPGFSPRFGVFTFGVPHRVGMSQYGAKGRAEAGQSASDILKAYFNADLTTVGTSTNIHVVGTNEFGQSFDDTWDIETYMKHVYEMPTSWAPEALKAQAIAARSMALAYTNNGSGSICPSQSCQVVKKESNSDAWIQAVNATAGQVLTNGGQPVKAWFSTTNGGFTHNSSEVWGSSTAWTKTAIDASGSVTSFSDLRNNAYDKSSPWFYCDWGSRSQYSGTAWLKSNELADIVNVILLAKADSSTVQHLSQPDKANPDGTDTWDADKVRQALKDKGITAFSSISNVSVSGDFGSGTTSTVNVSGDGGSQSISGNDFKSYFNLRAPANINIVGSLYNIEQK